MQLLKSELTSRILKCAFSVYNELGPFLREYCYQRAMELALSDAGLSWERQKPINIAYRGRLIGQGKVDLLVEDEVILELKAIEAIHPVFLSQLIAYLASSQKEVGFVLNFGHIGKLEFKRLVLTGRDQARGYRGSPQINPDCPPEPASSGLK